eukprot:maker-scaffold_2-snap-gene-8.33-mRNA-1 protein AED:0.01 eAED:0.01 QI:161/1/1/1/0/0/2/936/88
MKITVKKWQAIGYFHWGINDDCCGICRNEFESCCPSCTYPGSSCPPTWGECNHTFHEHCLLKWLDSLSEQNQEQRCPMCRAIWNFKET